ncbi:MAG: ATP-binding protein, partial [Candidatus Omnitrophica bacterium]|nr:ATP-binding protein [Candidatus Omnitrophota bacterium]
EMSGFTDDLSIRAPQDKIAFLFFNLLYPRDTRTDEINISAGLVRLKGSAGDFITLEIVTEKNGMSYSYEKSRAKNEFYYYPVLGWGVAKEIMEDLGGELIVTEEGEKRLRYTLKFPAQKAPPDVPPIGFVAAAAFSGFASKICSLATKLIKSLYSDERGGIKLPGGGREIPSAARPEKYRGFIRGKERETLRDAVYDIVVKIHDTTARHVYVVEGSGFWAGQLFERMWKALYPDEAIHMMWPDSTDRAEHVKALAAQSEDSVIVILDDFVYEEDTMTRERALLEGYGFKPERILSAALMLGKFAESELSSAWARGNFIYGSLWKEDSPVLWPVWWDVRFEVKSGKINFSHTNLSAADKKDILALITGSAEGPAPDRLAAIERYFSKRLPRDFDKMVEEKMRSIEPSDLDDPERVFNAASIMARLKPRRPLPRAAYTEADINAAAARLESIHVDVDRSIGAARRVRKKEEARAAALQLTALRDELSRVIVGFEEMADSGAHVAGYVERGRQLERQILAAIVLSMRVMDPESPVGALLPVPAPAIRHNLIRFPRNPLAYFTKSPIGGGVFFMVSDIRLIKGRDGSFDNEEDMEMRGVRNAIYDLEGAAEALRKTANPLDRGYLSGKEAAAKAASCLRKNDIKFAVIKRRFSASVMPDSFFDIPPAAKKIWRNGPHTYEYVVASILGEYFVIDPAARRFLPDPKDAKGVFMVPIDAICDNPWPYGGGEVIGASESEMLYLAGGNRSVLEKILYPERLAKPAGADSAGVSEDKKAPGSAISWAQILWGLAAFAPPIFEHIAGVSGPGGPLAAYAATAGLYLASVFFHELAHSAQTGFKNILPKAGREGVYIPGSKGWPGIAASAALAVVSCAAVFILPQYSTLALSAFIMNISFAFSGRDLEDVWQEAHNSVIESILRGKEEISFPLTIRDFVNSAAGADDRDAVDNVMAASGYGYAAGADSIHLEDLAAMCVKQCGFPVSETRHDASKVMIALAGIAHPLVDRRLVDSLPRLAGYLRHNDTEVRGDAQNLFTDFIGMSRQRKNDLFSGIISRELKRMEGLGISPVRLTLENILAGDEDLTRAALITLGEFAATEDRYMLAALAGTSVYTPHGNKKAADLIIAGLNARDNETRLSAAAAALPFIGSGDRILLNQLVKSGLSETLRRYSDSPLAEEREFVELAAEAIDIARKKTEFGAHFSWALAVTGSIPFIGARAAEYIAGLHGRIHRAADILFGGKGRTVMIVRKGDGPPENFKTAGESYSVNADDDEFKHPVIVAMSAPLVMIMIPQVVCSAVTLPVIAAVYFAGFGADAMLDAQLAVWAAVNALLFPFHLSAMESLSAFNPYSDLSKAWDAFRHKKPQSVVYMAGPGAGPDPGDGKSHKPETALSWRDITRGFAAGIFVYPILYFIGIDGEAEIIYAAVSSAVITPVSVIAHEFGHWLTTRFPGLPLRVDSEGAHILGAKKWAGIAMSAGLAALSLAAAFIFPEFKLAALSATAINTMLALSKRDWQGLFKKTDLSAANTYLYDTGSKDALVRDRGNNALRTMMMPAGEEEAEEILNALPVFLNRYFESGDPDVLASVQQILTDILTCRRPKIIRYLARMLESELPAIEFTMRNMVSGDANLRVAALITMTVLAGTKDPAILKLLASREIELPFYGRMKAADLVAENLKVDDISVYEGGKDMYERDLLIRQCVEKRRVSQHAARAFIKSGNSDLLRRIIDADVIKHTMRLMALRDERSSDGLDYLLALETIEALARTKDKAAIKELESLMVKSVNGGREEYAQNPLQLIIHGNLQREGLLDAGKDILKAARDALSALIEAGSPEFVESVANEIPLDTGFLFNDENHVRRNMDALIFLAGTGKPEITRQVAFQIPEIVERLKSRNMKIRISARDALGEFAKINDPVIRETMRDMAGEIREISGSGDIRAVTESLLREIGWLDMPPSLTAMLLSRIPVIGRSYARLVVGVHEILHSMADLFRGKIDILEIKSQGVIGGVYRVAGSMPFRHSAWVAMAAPMGPAIMHSALFFSLVGTCGIFRLITGIDISFLEKPVLVVVTVLMAPLYTFTLESLSSDLRVARRALFGNKYERGAREVYGGGIGNIITVLAETPLPDIAVIREVRHDFRAYLGTIISIAEAVYLEESEKRDNASAAEEAGAVASLGEAFLTALDRIKEGIDKNDSRILDEGIRSFDELSARIKDSLNPVTVGHIRGVYLQDFNDDYLADAFEDACRAVVMILDSYSSSSAGSVSGSTIDQAVHMAARLERINYHNTEMLIPARMDIPDVYGKPGDVLRICLNIIRNACEAMGDGGRIIISSGREGDMAVITISDVGCGMTPEKAAQFNDPRQLVVSTKGEGRGSGTNIMRALAVKYGGSVSVQSQIGLGSTFTIRLPIYGTQQDVSGPAPATLRLIGDWWDTNIGERSRQLIVGYVSWLRGVDLTYGPRV